MKVRNIYICDTCDAEFVDSKECQEHEKECAKNHVQLVTVFLYFDVDCYRLSTMVERRVNLDGLVFDAVMGKNDNCNEFYIRSLDVSEKNIKALEKRIVEEAITWIEEVRDDHYAYTTTRLEYLRGGVEKAN